jgi:uncharacterized protein YqiB (DUF1249 family)
MFNRRHPLDLSQAMATCDGNYIRILKLLPDFRLGQQRCFALPVPGVEDGAAAGQLVELRVVEQFRYTSCVSMQVRPTGRVSPYYRPPLLQVRLYHDACTAEVVSYQQQGAFHVRPRPGEGPEFSSDEKQQVNALLAEWLTLCLQQGLGGRHGSAEDPAAAFLQAP